MRHLYAAVILSVIANPLAAEFGNPTAGKKSP